MENFYNNMVSFFAIWFNDFKKHVFKVQVVNKDPSIEKKLTELSDTIRTHLSKTLLVAVSNQKDLSTAGIENKILELQRSIKDIKPQDLSKIERLLNELILSVTSIPQPKLPDIKIPETKFPSKMEISNFPKKQEVTGTVDVDFKKVVEGLQVVVDAIYDLKLETAQGLSSVSQVYAGQTGGRAAVKITDGEETATITNGKLDVNATVSVDTTGLATEDKQDAIITAIGNISVPAPVGGATSDNQTNGAQKAQIVDAGGEAVTVTGGKLDVNAAIDTTGLATSTKQSDGSQKSQIVDGSGNVIGATSNALDVNIKSSTSLAVTNAGITTIAGAVSGTEMQVDVLSMPTTTVQATDLDIRNLAAANDTVVVTGGASQTADVKITLDSEKVVVASIDAGDTNIGNVDLASAIPAGNNNIGDVDVASIAAGDNNIGNVDVATVPSDPFGANADAGSATGSISAKLRYLAASGIAGMTTLPAGTNAIGKLLPPDVDITTHTNYARKYYTSAGAATDGIIWSPAAGKRWHVVTMYIQISAAATITLEDDKGAGDDPVWKGELAANSGVVLQFSEKYPMASGEDAADLLITTTAGNVYVTCVGYEV